MARKFRLIPLLLLCAVPQISFGKAVEHAADASVRILPGQVLAKAKIENAIKGSTQQQDQAAGQDVAQYSELRFGGVEADGTIVLFSKTWLDTINAPATARGQLTYSKTNANANGAMKSEGTTSNNAGGRTKGMTAATGLVAQNVSGPNGRVVVPSDSVAMRLPKGTAQFTFGDKKIEIVRVEAESLTYRLGAEPNAKPD